MAQEQLPPQAGAPPAQDVLPTAKSVRMPDGQIHVFQAGTPVDLVLDAYERIAAQAQGPGAPQVFPDLQAEQPDRTGELAQVPGRDLISGGVDLGLDVAKILSGLLPGPAGKKQAVNTATKLARKLTGAIPRMSGAAGARVVAPAALSGLQAQLRGEDPGSAALFDAAFGAGGEILPGAVRLGVDALTPVAGLATGRAAGTTRRALEASARQAKKTGPLEMRPTLGSTPRLERRARGAMSDVKELVDAGTARVGADIPGSELVGAADEAVGKSARDLFPVEGVDIPVTALEDKFILNQLAKKMGTDPAEALSRYKRLNAEERWNIFSEMGYTPREVQDLVTSQADVIEKSFTRRGKMQPPLTPSETVEGDFRRRTAQLGKEATEKRIPELSEARSDLSDLKAMQALQQHIRVGIGAAPIRGAGAAAVAQVGNMLGIPMDWQTFLALGAAADPRLLGPAGEVIAHSVKASPTLKRAFEGKETVDRLRRREPQE